MKSVGLETIPPSNFKTQFINDLDNPEVTSLDQLRWWFDANEVNSLPKADFLDAIRGNGSTISQATLNKLLADLPVNNRTQESLMMRISAKFDEIFDVK